MLAPFRFEPTKHEYFLGDVKVPSITQLLELGGLVNGSEYFTEASRERGTAVHALCADFDMGVDLGDQLKVTPFKGYALAYIAAVAALKPEWDDIEVADVHPSYGFAGRTDRCGTVWGRFTVAELKSAAKAKHHPVQTALQAILATARRPELSADRVQRLTIYVKNTGRWSVEEHTDQRDFDKAHDLIRRFCR